MKCDCCEREGLPLKRYYWTKGDRICFDCFVVWYEGGIKNKEEIKRKVLEGG